MSNLLTQIMCCNEFDDFDLKEDEFDDFIQSIVPQIQDEDQECFLNLTISNPENNYELIPNREFEQTLLNMLLTNEADPITTQTQQQSQETSTIQTILSIINIILSVILILSSFN